MLLKAVIVTDHLLLIVNHRVVAILVLVAVVVQVAQAQASVWEAGQGQGRRVG
jgi:hypothetical protein